MRSLRELARSLGRAAALVVAGAALTATTVVDCVESGHASFAAETSCGPAGVVAMSFSGPTRPGCSGCWAFLEAPGASSVGLPEQGEIDTDREGHDPGSSAFDDGRFALVGPVTLAGDPPRTVERTCRFTPTGPGVLALACTGDDPAAACGGAATRIPQPEPAP